MRSGRHRSTVSAMRASTRRVGDGIARKPGGKRPERLRRRTIIGPLQREERLRRLVDRAPADLPLIEHLYGDFARTVPRILLPDANSAGARGGRHVLVAAGWRLSSAMTSAISRAAAAASRPLFSGPPPARASASSTEFVVSTPNVIGTPVAPATVVRP